MGQWTIQVDEKRLGSATAFYETVTISFVIPSEAEGSAVLRTSRGNADFVLSQDCHLACLGLPWDRGAGSAVTPTNKKQT
jgi:hypothetical protein